MVDGGSLENCCTAMYRGFESLFLRFHFNSTTMKRILLVIALAFVAAVSVNAQIKYKDLKTQYNYKEYTAQDIDPYRPGWAAALSFFVPGSSQLVMGEPVRGLLFLGGNLVINNIAEDSLENLVKLLVKDSEGNYDFSDWNAAKKEMLTLAISGAASLGLAIWSSIDASRVAKVKNQYYQNLHFAPAISFTPMQGGNLQPTAGIALSYNF